MDFNDWIREERKIKKYISRQSVWEAALRHGTPAKSEICPNCNGEGVFGSGSMVETKCSRCKGTGRL